MKLFNLQLNPALVSKSHDLERLTALLNGELPRETSGHYHVAGIDNSTLVIITDSPVWTTRLRQLGPSIIEILAERAAKNVNHVRIVSRRGSIKTPYQPNQTVNRILSAKSGQHLSQTAEYIQDNELKNALLKLSERVNKSD